MDNISNLVISFFDRAFLLRSTGLDLKSGGWLRTQAIFLGNDFFEVVHVRCGFFAQARWYSKFIFLGFRVDLDGLM